MMEDVEFFRVQQQQQQAAVCLFVCLFQARESYMSIPQQQQKRLESPKKDSFYR
jgi:hypothetical protein